MLHRTDFRFFFFTFFRLLRRNNGIMHYTLIWIHIKSDFTVYQTHTDHFTDCPVSICLGFYVSQKFFDDLVHSLQVCILTASQQICQRFLYQYRRFISFITFKSLRSQQYGDIIAIALRNRKIGQAFVPLTVYKLIEVVACRIRNVYILSVFIRRLVFLFFFLNWRNHIVFTTRRH